VTPDLRHEQLGRLTGACFADVARLVWILFLAGAALVAWMRAAGAEQGQYEHVDFAYEGPRYDEISEALPHREAVELAIRVAKSCILTTRNTPWQMMHGVLAFGKDFSIVDAETGRRAPALQYVFDQASYRNLTVPGPFVVELSGRPHILRGNIRETEDHDGQFLYICSQAGVPLEFPIVCSNGRRYALKDLLENGMDEVHALSKCVWLAPAFAYYLEPGQTWNNKFGQEMSVERLIENILSHGPGYEACFGTYAAYALAFALTEHHRKGGRSAPVWGECAGRVDELLGFARRNQNADGSFTYRWYERGGPLFDEEDVIHVTGHMLEWIVVAVAKEEIQADWISDAADVTARTILRRVHEDTSYGVISHAARALQLYCGRKYSGGFDPPKP